MLVKSVDGNKSGEIHDAIPLLEKARENDERIKSGADYEIEESPSFIAETKYKLFILLAVIWLYLSIMLIGNLRNDAISYPISAVFALLYIFYVLRFFRKNSGAMAAAYELNEHRERVVAHNRALRSRRAAANAAAKKARIEAERREAERKEREERAEAQRRRDELMAQKQRDADMFLNEYMSFEWERQRRAQLIYVTAPLIKAFWSDYLALADLSPSPFNPESDFRKYFWELFDEAARENKNKTDAMKCIHEIADPLLQQPIAYIKADLPPRWPPLIPSPEWARLKNPSIPLDAQMSEMRSIFRKPGNLPLYLDTLEAPIKSHK